MSRVKTWLSEVFRVNPAGLNWPRGVLFLTVTLVAGLSVAYGVRRFVWGSLLSIWFIIPLGNAFTSHHHAQTPSYTWAQVLAWVGGSALWIAMTFLACVYGEEDDTDKRKQLEKILVGAAKFSRDAQTNRGGWGYLSAKEGNNFDEGSVTITQMQGLRAVRNAGVAVPPEAIKDGLAYLKASTNGQGGVIYSLAGGGGGDGRPALTAAAIACGFSGGDYNSPLVKQWFKFCKTAVPSLGGGRFGHDEYTHYYYAQALYILGDDGWGKLFPDSKADDRMTWSKYRKETFDYLKRTQGTDGSWTGGHVGPVFITAAHLTILQLDNAVVPLYMR